MILYKFSALDFMMFDVVCMKFDSPSCQKKFGKLYSFIQTKRDTYFNVQFVKNERQRKYDKFMRERGKMVDRMGHIHKL